MSVEDYLREMKLRVGSPYEDCMCRKEIPRLLRIIKRLRNALENFADVQFEGPDCDEARKALEYDGKK